MKEEINGRLLESITIKYGDNLTNLITDYTPLEFSVSEKENLNNIRKDMIVNIFNLIKLKIKLPKELNNEEDIKNIFIIEKKYNQYNTVIFFKMLTNKYVIEDYLYFDILLPSIFTIRKFMVIYAKEIYKI